MNLKTERPLLWPPLKTPRGWYVVYQPDYPAPNVFHLHERGMFAGRPPIRRDFGARIVADEDLRAAVQYMSLTDEIAEDPDSGKRFSCVNRHGLVSLGRTLNPDKGEMKGEALERKVAEEVRRVAGEWASAFAADILTLDAEEVKRSLRAAVERGRRLSQEWLIRSNQLWIQPVLPRMIQNFKRGLHERVADTLFADYRQRGGVETEGDLIRKINLFVRVYEGSGLIKPNGDPWRNEDELWDCWVAFAGSEPEAKRICKTIEQVLLPLKEEIEEELEAAA